MKTATTADVIVVGAGTGGCVLAARLSDDPDRRVLLPEAGPDYATPAILLRSGIGPGDDLRGLGIRVAAHSSGVERADHRRPS